MIKADWESCSGCGRCEMACSFARTRTYSRIDSVIRLASVNDLGLDFPVTCILCGECESACPSDALHRTPDGLITLDVDLCTSCGACREACPIGILEFETHPAFCTACGACVEACNLNVLSLKPGPGPAPPKAWEAPPKTPAVRRALWAISHGSELSWIDEHDLRVYRQSIEG